MLSIPHMIVVFVIVLVVFGPQKLPELARGLGKMMAEFRKASTDFKSAFEEEMRDLERQAREVERRKAEAAASTAATAQTQPATLATPSSAETQGGGGESAAAGATEEGIAEAGEGEGPLVAPVAEGNVARETDMETPSAPANSEVAEAAGTPEMQAKAQKADSSRTKDYS
jgi:sec-independent protein translocase protein TatB